MAWLHVEYADGEEEPTWSWSTFANCIEDTLLSWATLCDRNVSLGKRLRYFDGMISPVTVLAAGNRTIYKTDLRNLNVLFRNLFLSFCRSMAWNPAWLERSSQWICVPSWHQVTVKTMCPATFGFSTYFFLGKATVGQTLDAMAA